MDLRERVARAVAGGTSKAEAARRYAIGLSTVQRYVARQAAGALRPGVGPGRSRALDAVDGATLRAQVAAYPDATIAAHRRLWGEAGGAAVSASTLGRALLRVGWTRKKSRRAPPSGTRPSARRGGRRRPPSTRRRSSSPTSAAPMSP